MRSPASASSVADFRSGENRRSSDRRNEPRRRIRTMSFTRRDILKTTAGSGAASMAPSLLGGRKAFAQDLSYKPEEGASLRLLRWSPFVKGDEEAWLANTKKFTEATGV